MLMGFVLILKGSHSLSRDSCWFKLMFILIGLSKGSRYFLQESDWFINLSRVPLQFNRIPTNPINSTKMLGEYQNLLTINHAPIRKT